MSDDDWDAGLLAFVCLYLIAIGAMGALSWFLVYLVG